MYGKKNILVIGTGGTIAGIGEEETDGNYKSAQVKISKIIEKMNYINSLANIRSADIFQIDSCDITIENLKELSNFVNSEAERDDVDGIVITHGTDTLEETAYFLNLTVKTEKPVVLTGAMRAATSISADGPLNLYQAIALASSTEAKGKGILVSFNDAICAARDVTKVNTFKTQAFDQRDFGCLGYIQYDKPFFYTNSIKKHTFQTQFDLSSIDKFPKVEIFYFYTDADEKILDYIVKNSDGVVVAGAGSGGLSTKMNEKVKSLLKKGFPIVRSSRVGNGIVAFDDEEIYSSGIYANNLNAQKSRILLMLALTVTSDIKEIQDIFNTY